MSERPRSMEYFSVDAPDLSFREVSDEPIYNVEGPILRQSGETEWYEYPEVKEVKE